MYRSMVDIQSATAKIRRGKKEERKKKKQDQNIMSASATQGCDKKNPNMHETVVQDASSCSKQHTINCEFPLLHVFVSVYFTVRTVYIFRAHRSVIPVYCKRFTFSTKKINFWNGHKESCLSTFSLNNVNSGLKWYFCRCNKRSKKRKRFTMCETSGCIQTVSGERRVASSRTKRPETRIVVERACA